MDLDLVTRALKINGVTKLVFNKVDVLRETNTWKLISGGKTVEFDSEEHMKTQTLTLGAETEIFFSDNKNGI
jgi:adenylosuccinate synthase